MNNDGLFLKSLLAVLFLTTVANTEVAVPAEWQFSQDLTVAQRGLVRFPLPAATLSVAQAGLNDLRLRDTEGNELAYTIDRPVRRLGFAGIAEGDVGKRKNNSYRNCAETSVGKFF